MLNNEVRILPGIAESGHDIGVDPARNLMEEAGANPALGVTPGAALAAALRTEARLEAARKSKAGGE